MKTYNQSVHGFFTIGEKVIPNDNRNSDFIKMNQEVADGEAEIILGTISLEQVKGEKKAQIDNRTDELIFAGITHNSVNFKINVEKEISAIALNSARMAGMNMAGKKFRARSETYVFESTADFDAWFAQAFTRVETILISGSELKDLVDEAETAEEIELIVDERV